MPEGVITNPSREVLTLYRGLKKNETLPFLTYDLSKHFPGELTVSFYGFKSYLKYHINCVNDDLH